MFYINALWTSTKKIDVALLISEATLLLDSIETVPDFEESHRTTEGYNSWPFKIKSFF